MSSHNIQSGVGPDPAEVVIRGQLLSRRRRLEEAAGVAPSAQLADLLEQVDAALERLETGSIGECELCHDDIEPDRLASDPLTTVCVDCLSPDARRALEYDLSLAASIQTALLPPNDLVADGWDFHFEYCPAGTVSGDYLDLIATGSGDDELFFVLGDVAGKGVSAAILMSNLQAIFRSLAGLGVSLVEMMVRANRMLCSATTSSSYATLVGGRVGPGGRLEVANAGHVPPILARARGIEPIPATGMPLGLFCEIQLEVRSFDMAPGDTAFLYTDGLSEAVDHRGTEYGYQGISSALESHVNGSARATALAVLDDVNAHGGRRPAADDLSMLVIRRSG